MELLMLVVGIVLLWKFASSLNSMATSAKAKTQVMAESVVADAVKERTIQFEKFQEEMEGRKIYSHEEVMAIFKVND